MKNIKNHVAKVLVLVMIISAMQIIPKGFFGSDNETFAASDIIVDNDFVTEGDCLVSYNGNETEVYIPDGIVTIKTEAFKGSSVEKVIMPDSVKDIEVNAFLKCDNLKEVVLSANLKSLYGNFNDCISLEKIVFPEEKLVEIEYSFNNCPKLDEIKLPETIYFLKSSFNNCTGLTSLIVPKNVSTLSGFSGCTGLETIVLNPEKLIIWTGVFENDTSLKIVKAHDGNVLADYMKKTFGVKVLSLDNYENCDIDCNGMIELSDAQIALKGSLGINDLNEIEISSSDFDGDGKIGLSDVTIVLKGALGIISEDELMQMKPPKEEVKIPEEPIDYSKTSEYFEMYKFVLKDLGIISDTVMQSQSNIILNDKFAYANSEDMKAIKKLCRDSYEDGKIFFAGSVDEMLAKGLAKADSTFWYYVIDGCFTSVNLSYATETEMVADVMRYTNGLAGNTQYYYYEKKDGEWVRTRVEQGPVS